MIKQKFTVIAICTLLLGAHTKDVQAQQNTDQAAAKPPLEITADGSLEWFKKEQKFIARGKAMASQDGSSISAETLTANYRDGAQGRFEISKITADENVIIRAQNSTAYGDQATYTLDNATAIMTGDNLRMISPDQSVTANERFEYHVNDGKLLAIGNATASRPNQNGGIDTLNANTISAVFKENAQGERVLETLEAQDNVTIKTTAETIKGNYAVYKSSTNTAQMKGNVKITRGPNTLEGNRAEIDLNTNTSKIFGGGTQNNGRVKAVFYPSSDE